MGGNALEQTASRTASLSRVPAFVRDRRYWLVLLACWAALVGISLRDHLSDIQRYQPLLDAARPSIYQAWVTHLTVFVFGLAGCGCLLVQLRRRWLDLAEKIMEVELARDNLVQSEKLASLGRTVAGFAHEINTPIGVALGAISNSEETLRSIDHLLDDEEVSEADLRAALATLRQGDSLAVSNLRRAAALVQSFKRTSIDQASEQARVFSVREVIEDVLHTLHNQLKRLPVTLAVDCPADLEIDGVPGLLEQLLTNLILNSLLHGFREGELAGEIHIDVHHADGRLFLDYSDTGCGMPPDVQSRIFEPFFTTRRSQGGSGLGMYICNNIVSTRLAGRIRCESAPGAGSRFLIDFPARCKEKH